MKLDCLTNAGVNLVEDAIKLGKAKTNLKPCYETACQLVKSRPGFVKTTAEDAHAVGRDGRLLDGYVRELVNPQAGLTEKIYYSGSNVERVIYDANKRPLGAVVVDFAGAEKTCYPRVYKPSPDGDVVEILANGTERASNYYGVTDFSKAFNFRDIQAYVKNIFKSHI